MEVVWLESAIQDLIRLRQFIAKHNPSAAKKMSNLLLDAVNKLEHTPNIGKPVLDLIDYRDLGIRFGAAGYVLRYRILDKMLYVIGLRHYRETLVADREIVEEPA